MIIQIFALQQNWPTLQRPAVSSGENRRRHSPNKKRQSDVVKFYPPPVVAGLWSSVAKEHPVVKIGAQKTKKGRP